MLFQRAFKRLEWPNFRFELERGGTVPPTFRGIQLNQFIVRVCCLLKLVLVKCRKLRDRSARIQFQKQTTCVYICSIKYGGINYVRGRNGVNVMVNVMVNTSTIGNAQHT